MNVTFDDCRHDRGINNLWPGYASHAQSGVSHGAIVPTNPAGRSGMVDSPQFALRNIEAILMRMRMGRRERARAK